MASGCIVGECPSCLNWVFEDEWSQKTFDEYSTFVHIGCRRKFVNLKKQIAVNKQKEERIKKLEALLKSHGIDYEG